MVISSATHFFNEQFVAVVKRSELTAPTHGFRVASISLFILGENDPERMQLTMFSQQMLPAEHRRRQIPNSHLFDQLFRGNRDLSQCGANR